MKVQREILVPAESTSFDVVMNVIKLLQDDYGALVTEVDAIQDGMQFNLRLPSDQPLLRLRARWRSIELTGERARERLDRCHRQSLVIEQQRGELARQQE